MCSMEATRCTCGVTLEKRVETVARVQGMTEPSLADRLSLLMSALSVRWRPEVCSVSDPGFANVADTSWMRHDDPVCIGRAFLHLAAGRSCTIVLARGPGRSCT